MTNLLERLASLCLERGLTVGVAESCTGGLVASSIVDVPGASKWFRGGVVCYATDLKGSILGVDKDLLAKKGSVCAEVALEMAKGALHTLSCDIAISITGLAGPAGDPYGIEPVGTVYFGIASNRAEKVFRKEFSGTRKDIRHLAATYAISCALAALSHP